MIAIFSREALRALSRNRLRSTLAAVGITIGIAAVVCVVAIGEAGSRRAEEQFYALGDNLVWIEAGSRAPNGVRTGSHGTTTLTVEDANAIGEQVPQIKSVSVQADGNVQVVYGNRNWRTHYRGVAPDFLEIKRWTIALGAPFTEEQVRRVESVCVLGQTVREQLFGAANPVGEIVRLGTQLCQVIGVLAPKGQSQTGQDQDDTMLLPYTMATKKLRGKTQNWVDDILCSASSAREVPAAIGEAQALLRQRHRIGIGQEDDFNIRRPDEILKAQIETSKTLAALLISIAAISLMVGGIGVMNVMLVSVAERTREIGLRLAVGATGAAVRLQFLGEAVMLCCFGGLCGILFGALGCAALGSTLGWNVSVPAAAVIVAPLFSIAVGIFFGFYPAVRASRLDPIEALRHE